MTIVTRKAIVVEVFSHNSTQVVVTARYQSAHEFIFMLIPNNPVVTFGDTLTVEADSQGECSRITLCRNEKLTYTLRPETIPTEVLRQLIEDRL